MPSRVLETMPVKDVAPPKPTAEAPTERQIVAAIPNTQPMFQAPRLKLSFGGVDFSLLPRVNSDGTVVFETMGANEAVLSLKNFTGTLHVVCTSSAATDQLVRRDSVTPSPDKCLPRPSPNQRQLVAHTQAAESPHLGGMTRQQSHSSSAPTPTTANGNGKQPSHRRNSVEEVVTANRSSPLPYHSPVKRSRDNKGKPTKEQQPAVKKTKKTTPLFQHLPPTPIATQKPQSSSDISQPRHCSQPDCSQTQRSSSSQVSADDAMDESEAERVKLTQTVRPFNEEEDKEIEDDHLMQEDDQESVATRKAEDEDDESLATRNQDGEEADGLLEAGDEEKAEETGKETPKENPETSTSVTMYKPKASPTVIKPSNRWGHTMTMIDHNRILVYGGQGFEAKDGNVVPTTLSDVYVFDLEKKKWFQPIHCDDNTRKFPLQWSSSTFVPQRSLLIVFGGESMGKSGKVRTSDKNNLMVLDTEILLWYPPSVSGDLPSGRSGHSGTLLPSSSNNELVIFGGVKGGKHLNTVSVLDTKAWRWSTPKIQGTKPAARSYHTATAIKATHCSDHSDHISNSKTATINIRQRIVVFGGNDANKSFNTVHVLEKIEGANCTWRWFHPTVSGKPPRARTGHTATLLADQKTICVYGGWDPSEDDEDKPRGEDDSAIFFQDSFLLDTDTWTWKQGPAPVFAGHSLDASQGTDGGGRRAGHCAVLNTSNKSSDEVLIFGGRVPGDEFAGDFQSLTIIP